MSSGKMFAKKAAVWVFVFGFASGLGCAESQILLFGKMVRWSSAGGQMDYDPGVNDFPMSESYRNLGLGLGYRSGNKVFFTLEGHFDMSTTMTLVDPSDNDSVKIDTYPSVLGLVSVGLNALKSQRMSLFIQGGVGLKKALNADTKVYFSEKGFETEIDPPEKTVSFVSFLGIGGAWFISRAAGIFADGRYQITHNVQKQNAFVVDVGLIFRF